MDGPWDARALIEVSALRLGADMYTACSMRRFHSGWRVIQPVRCGVFLADGGITGRPCIRRSGNFVAQVVQSRGQVQMKNGLYSQLDERWG